MCDASDGCEELNDLYSILGSTHPASHHSWALQVVYLINALQWKILSRWWNSYTVSVTSSADTYVFSPPNARPTTTMPRKDRVHNSHHLAQKLSLMLWWSLQFSQKGQLNSVTNGFPIVRGMLLIHVWYLLGIKLFWYVVCKGMVMTEYVIFIQEMFSAMGAGKPQNLAAAKGILVSAYASWKIAPYFGFPISPEIPYTPDLSLQAIWRLVTWCMWPNSTTTERV